MPGTPPLSRASRSSPLTCSSRWSTSSGTPSSPGWRSPRPGPEEQHETEARARVPRILPRPPRRRAPLHHRHQHLAHQQHQRLCGVRPLKTQQKISGRLASDGTTQDRLDIRSYIDTARKHGKNAMDVLHDLMLGSPWRPPAQAFSP